MSDEQQGQQANEPTPPAEPQQYQQVPQAPQAPQAPPVYQQPQQQQYQQPADPYSTPQNPGEPQWIPAAPPHPYASVQPAKTPAGLKALAITSMALGLAALLTLIVAVGFFDIGIAVLGVALGIIALAIGIVALVKKANPIGAAITGVGAGALSTLTATALVALGTFAFGQAKPTEVVPEGSWTPGTAQESLLDWPSNMSSGGIIFEGPGDPQPMPSDPLQAGAAPTPNSVNREAGNDIVVYVDYRCPHCMEFEVQNGEYLASLIESGNTTVEVVPLSFMDRMSDGSKYSSRATGAVACFTDLQPELAWKAHSTLLTPQVQPGVGPGLNNDELITAFQQGVDGMSKNVGACIKNERFVPFAQGLNDWVFANPVPNTLAESVRIQGTPTILVNGLVYPGDPIDPEAFRAFVEEQAN